MSIEVELGRIATALEKIASGQGNLPLAQPVAAEPAKRGPGRPKKGEEAPAAPPATEEETAVDDLGGETDSFLDVEDAKPVTYTIEDVRAAIVGYQKKVGSQEKARKLLKDVGGADTLKSLSESKYAAVIEATKK